MDKKSIIIAYALVIIGDECFFSFRNMILTSTHDYKDIPAGVFAAGNSCRVIKKLI